MILPGMENFAQVVAERMVDSLPEGVLLTFGAWLLLCLMRRQNSETRFVVWLVALIGVVSLPLANHSGHVQTIANFSRASEFVVSSFWALAFLTIWLPLACLGFARVVSGLWQIRQIRRCCAELPSASLDPELRSIVEKSQRNVRILVSDRVRVPAALGFFKPAVVLPTWIFQGIASVEIRHILIHELAHLRRYDSWTNLFQKIMRSLFFFHPAVWWIDSRLSLEREMACDDAVISATADPHGYAGSLVGLLEKSCSRRGWAMAQAAVARSREASQRISRLLSLSGSAGTKGVALPAVGLAMVLLVACGGIAMSFPQLLAFAPDGARAHASRAREHLGPDRQDNETGGAVVAAAFHPEHATGVAHSADIKRPEHVRMSPLQPVTLRKVRKPVSPSPVVMADLMAFGSRNLGSLSGAETQTSAYAHEVQFQSRDGEITQVETVQFVQQGSAIVRVQFVRILIAIPSPDSALSGSAAHAI